MKEKDKIAVVKIRLMEFMTIKSVLQTGYWNEFYKRKKERERKEERKKERGSVYPSSNSENITIWLGQ